MLNVNTSGSLRMILVPSGTVLGSGREYAVDAIRCDGISWASNADFCFFEAEEISWAFV